MYDDSETEKNTESTREISRSRTRGKRSENLGKGEVWKR